MNFTPAAAAESTKRAEKLSTLSPGSCVHVIGICGTGMAAVASLLGQLGFRVTGSDKAFYPPMGEVVRGVTDELYEGYSAENLAHKPDFVVIGNSLSRNNPEVQHVISQNIPYASMPEVFSALLIGKRSECPHSVVVTGTHGKSTTTALIATMLEAIGRKPGYFIGAVPNELPTNIRPPAKDRPVEERVVVLEGDEYDSAFFAKWAKFHSYRPDILVITSLEFDHADIYESLEAIIEEFQAVVRAVPKGGAIVVCDRDDVLRRLAAEWKVSDEVKADVFTYGTHRSSEFRLISRDLGHGTEELGQSLTLRMQNETLEFRTSLAGSYNALNLLAGAAVGVLLKLPLEEIAAGLSKYSGSKRRQQIVGRFDGITVIEDFAHHPTAVRLTLEGIRESFSEQRIVAVFEPRSNTSRRDFFQNDYVHAFAAANIVVLLELENVSLYSNTSTPVVPLDVKKLTKDLLEAGHGAFSMPSSEKILSFLMRTLNKNDVVVVMSNGDFGGLLPALLKSLGEGKQAFS